MRGWRGTEDNKYLYALSEWNLKRDRSRGGKGFGGRGGRDIHFREIARFFIRTFMAKARHGVWMQGIYVREGVKGFEVEREIFEGRRRVDLWVDYEGRSGARTEVFCEIVLSGGESSGDAVCERYLKEGFDGVLWVVGGEVKGEYPFQVKHSDLSE